jgi:Neuraminidase (sialidase)
MKLTLLLICTTLLTPPLVAYAQSPVTDLPRRLIAIDNVCAWPNLVKLKDGSLVAIVFNQPNHGRTEGDVDCWGSKDGLLWNKLSTITQHEPQTNRMNHAAGLNASGDLVVLCNGWDKVAPQRNADSRPIQTVVCISRDGGKTWTQGGPVWPKEEGLSWLVPFGDITPAANGDLVASGYAFGKGPGKAGNIYAVRSKDGGKTWPTIAPIVQDKHCESAILHLGAGKWLTVSRRFGILDLDIFTSEDDALTWQHATTLDIKPVSSAHLAKLSDGRVLLTYGNRTPGSYGIEARTTADSGKTWSKPQNLVALDKSDCGYPDAIELAGGRIVIAYYTSGISQHQRYHMGVLNLSINDLH